MFKNHSSVLHGSTIKLHRKAEERSSTKASVFGCKNTNIRGHHLHFCFQNI